MDFVKIKKKLVKSKEDNQDYLTFYPSFIVRKSKDLMIKGGDFYAFWDEQSGLWSRDEFQVIKAIDQKTMDEMSESGSDRCKALRLEDGDSGLVDKWHKFTQKQMRDNYHDLDKKVVFANTPANKDDYATKKLPYSMEQGECKAYNELVSVLYSPEERMKFEWAIGSVIAGDSVKIQKFLVFYGAPGSGKSTILNIVQMLLPWYCGSFDARALGSKSDSFALEPFKNNPLVAIDHEADLSKIETNTRLNSIVSHEELVVNEKRKNLYTMKFNSLLLMGSNKPVMITDSKSGLLRRLIDVNPTGNKVSLTRYNQLMSQIQFELGEIAWHCKDVYEKNKYAYEGYIPSSMLGATNDLYNFLEEKFDDYFTKNEITLGEAWPQYKKFCDEANVPYPLKRTVFREEMKSYFKDFIDRKRVDGLLVRSVYSGFRAEKFGYVVESKIEEAEPWLKFNCIRSLFDKKYEDNAAQYASAQEIPANAWDDVKTKLRDLDTSRLHYVRVPVNHVVIDFDLKDSEGNKSLKLNLEAASKWPETYAELSKSGQGIHLHYIYDGDVNTLSRIYSPGIEVKVFAGKSSLRRKLTKCNNKDIATIKGGLPKKEEVRMVNSEAVKTEKGLRVILENCLAKKHHGATKPEVDYIYDILNRAYESGLHYDVSDMRQAILNFAMSSTHQADYCVKLLQKMKFKSDEPSANTEEKEAMLVFFDVEVFPNLFVVVWKAKGKDPVKMINPLPAAIEELAKYNLVGFNNRRYDNHILYARIMGYSNEQLFNLSQRIINGHGGFFGEAYNLSYTDIYDFSSKKQSLKKWEIELGIHHQELGLPWDKPVPEDQWELVADYCINDVVATEAVFEARQQDFAAREVLASLSGLTVNDTTRMHATKIIFGNNKHPDLVYTDLSELFPGYEFDIKKPNEEKSRYMGEFVGEGGYVYAEPGMYKNVALLDIASMHPSSIIALNLFGEYTVNFKAIKEARLAVKHHDYEKAKTFFNGALAPHLGSDEDADSLAYALKIIINCVYGYTTATFDNPFKDPRNVDNIVAKRGALFMVELKHAVQEKGFTVAHIKTDSIKIPDATPEIIQFVIDFGKKYGYDFEHEATYSDMCLVNDAVYVARYADGEHEVKLATGEKIQTDWTATGAQFQVPYVFKTLFAHKPIVFKDLCETKTVTSALYLDMNEDLPDVSDLEKEAEKLLKWLKTHPEEEYDLEFDENGKKYTELQNEISKGHNYHFVGRAGQFCPIKPGHGGGILLREKDGKFSAATGTKGYRWMESEMVKHLHLEDAIDHGYYRKLVDDAVETIEKYGDFEMFVSDNFINKPE